MKVWKKLVIAIMFLSFVCACVQKEKGQEASKPAQQIIMEEYIKNYDGYGKLFLYDITGDGFPELLNGENFDGFFVDVYDFSEEEPKWIGQFSGKSGGKVYVCKDTEGKRFLLSHDGWYQSMGYIMYYCNKTNILEHALENELLGESVSYLSDDWDDDLYYHGMMYFDGEKKEPLGFCREENGTWYETENALIQCMNDYMKDCEILDVLTLPDYGQEEAFVRSMEERAGEYHYVPDYQYNQWYEMYQKELETRKVTICGKDYDSQTELLNLDRSVLDETFDSDILNEFPNLRRVYFEGSAQENNDTKLQIKASAWCSQIMEMRFSPKDFELQGNLEAFSNLLNLTIYGRGEELNDISYLCELPNVRILNLWVDDTTMEFVKLISGIESVHVITYSGQFDFFGEMTGEEIKLIFETLSDKLFVYVK